MIVATLIVQGILLSIAFPITELWTHTPLLYNDNAYHLYQMKLGHAFAATGTLVGYDPAFAAGYPGGISSDPSAKLPWLLAAGFHGLVDDIILYKFCVFLCGVLGPVWIPVAIRRLGANAPSMALGAAFAVILWWASWLRWLFMEGMVSFVTVSYLSVPYLVEIIRYLEGEGGIRKVVAISAAGAGLFFLHPHFPIAIVIGTLLSVMLGWPHVTAKRLLLLALVVPALSLLPNLPWLIAFRQYGLFSIPQYGLKSFTTYFNAVDINIVWREAIGIYRGTAHGSKAYAVIIWCTLAAWIFIRGRAERTRVQVFALLGLALIVFAAVGCGLPMFRYAELNRLAPLGYLFLVVPAVFGLKAMRSAGRRDERTVLVVGAQLSTVAVAAIAVYCLYEVFVEASNVDKGHYGQRPPQVRALPERVQCVTKWLESDTTRQGRVLFEVFPGGGQGSDPAYYAYKTNREFIGGPMPDMFFAGFFNGILFKQPIVSMSEERFTKYMELYNIGWIVAHSAETKRTLEGFPEVAKAGQCENLTAYRVERPLNYFLEGRGNVAASGFNELVLDGLEGAAIVLKYNYAHGLKSTPETKIEPVAPMDGMPPFIRIVAPPRTLRLYLEWQLRWSAPYSSAQVGSLG